MSHKQIRFKESTKENSLSARQIALEGSVAIQEGLESNGRSQKVGKSKWIHLNKDWLYKINNGKLLGVKYVEIYIELKHVPRWEKGKSS